jgi:glutathione S-transferase
MTLLTHFPLCPHSRSIRLALSELGVKCEMAEERPWDWRPEFLALNPSGDLPVLELDGSAVLAGAYAISEYLDEARPGSEEGRRMVLFPGDAQSRAEVRRLVDWFHKKLDGEVTRELLREKLHPRVRPELASQTPDTDLMRAIGANLRYHMSYMNHLVDQRSWLAGDDMSFADLAAAAHLSCLDYCDEVPWDEHSAARSWYARVKSRPSFRPLLADRLAGAPPPKHYADLDF